MSKSDEQMDVVLVRLVNNDRLIGQIVSVDKDAIALYAPMLIAIKESDYIFSPYDPLSSTAMAILSHDLIMTLTVPKEKVLNQYDDSWPLFYPDIKDVRKKMMERRIQEDEGLLDVDTLNEMFSSLLSDSLPINKKKLH
jgi:hypothetical protein